MDFLVEMGKRDWVRKTWSSLKLPVSLPLSLDRDLEPEVARPLAGKLLVVGRPSGALSASAVHALAQAGCGFIDSGAELADGVEQSLEAYGSARVAQQDASRGADVLVFDASGIAHTDALIELYQFFHEWVGRIRSHGRALVIAHGVGDAADPMRAAVVAALSGFVRSLAKEIGRKAATAHLIEVAPGAERNAEAVIRFLASRRSAFLTGQIWHVTPAGHVSRDFIRELEGKIALVTGAARGIGEAIAHRLAQEGATVVVLDRPEARDDAARVADRLGGFPLLADLADPAAAAYIAGELKKRFGRVDIVVHNAGIIRDRTLSKMNEEVWQIVMNVNLAAIDRLHRALEPMIPAGGRMVALSSVAGIAGNFGQTNYAASKSGLIGYVTALARALAEKQITANIVAPGFIDTVLTRTIPLANREAARRMSALGQGGVPEDIANLITFLSSPSAAGLNGQVLRACGGMFIGA